MTPISRRDRAQLLFDDLCVALDITGWTLHFDKRPRTRLGHCRFAVKEIGLSTWVVDGSMPWGEVEDTLRHELAHVLAGKGHGHDRVWRDACVLTGADPKRTSHVASEHRAPAAWIGTCSVCGIYVERHRRTLQAYHPECGRAGRIVWRRAS